MLQPRRLSTITHRILHLLAACTSCTQLSQIQAQILVRSLHSDPLVFSSFLTACRFLRQLSAAVIFHLSSHPRTSLCNSIIRALSRSNPTSDTPFLVFQLMVNNSIPPNDRTFPALLKSLSDTRNLRQGQAVHAHVVKTGFYSNAYIQNSLLGFYSSCGEISTCDELFDEILLRDVVSWTSMIVAHKNVNRFSDALVLFREMQMTGVCPNRVTMVSALAACAGRRALDVGLAIHGFVIRRGWEADVVLGTSLLDMYGKCGMASVCRRLFQAMPVKNVYTWNSLIAGLATVDGREAVGLFFRMQQEGPTADEATLVAVLMACSHAGMVRMGEWIFQTILDGKHGFMPGIKHYGCIVDMFGRAGMLEEALECIELMPFRPNAVVWRAMLGGCLAHGSTELAELAVDRLVELDPASAAAYHALLADLYLESGKQHTVSVKEPFLKVGCGS